MKPIAFIFTLIFMVIALMGCGTSKVKQASCNGNDWQALGRQAALDAQSVRVFDQYIASCPSLKNEDKKLFIAGYRDGLKQFCSYENGYKIAVKDKSDPNVCPYELRAEFERGYKEGSAELMNQKYLKQKLKDQSEERRMRNIDQLDRDQNRSN